MTRLLPPGVSATGLAARPLAHNGAHAVSGPLVPPRGPLPCGVGPRSGAALDSARTPCPSPLRALAKLRAAAGALPAAGAKAAAAAAARGRTACFLRRHLHPALLGFLRSSRLFLWSNNSHIALPRLCMLGTVLPFRSCGQCGQISCVVIMACDVWWPWGCVIRR